MKRVHPSRWPGVYLNPSKERMFEGKPDVCFYFTMKVGGKQRYEKVGWKSEGYGPEVAAELRAQRMKAARHGEEVLTQREIQQRRNAHDRTLAEIADRYFQDKAGSLKGYRTDLNRWELHLKPKVGRMQASQVHQLTIAAIKKDLGDKAPATVWNVLELMRRLLNYGAKNGYCPPLPFVISMPKKDNEVVEYLEPEQAEAFVELLENWPSQDVPRMLKLAMFTGMRRGEIFKLTDDALDFRQRLISIREPKGGKSVAIPMNTIAENILREQLEWRDQRFPGSKQVFPGQGGKERVDCPAVYRMKKKANLPEGFRIFHGLRHHYAVTLANSGEFTLDMIGELLTHKSHEMTRRYASYLPGTMRDAADRAAELLGGKAGKKSNVVEMKKKVEG